MPSDAAIGSMVCSAPANSVSVPRDSPTAVTIFDMIVDDSSAFALKLCIVNDRASVVASRLAPSALAPCAEAFINFRLSDALRPYLAI